VFSQSINQLQKALTAKADSIQREFITISEQLTLLSRKVIEAMPEDRPPLEAEQAVLRERRAVIAEDVNVWRDRAKDILNQPGDDALRAYLQELLDTSKEESQIQATAKHVLVVLSATEEELAAMMQSEEEEKPQTPAGRLLYRARKEYDLRGEDADPRLRTTAEFTNRQGMIQDEAAIAELEAAVYDPDKFVREVALLTLIQIHRARALRLSELDQAYQSVLRLTRMNHPGAIAVLVNIVDNQRTGFVRKTPNSEPVEVSNSRLRVAALKRLVEWHTPEARRAVEGQQLSRDEEVSYLCQRALEAFPGEWKGPIRGTGILL
jgi:hypothetical protein